MTTYSDFDQFLGAKSRRPLSGKRGTDVRRIDAQTIALRYHDTDVVTYFADGRYRFNTDGWRTLTTKDRINSYSPVHIWQTKGEWLTPAGPFADHCEYFNGQWSGLSENLHAKRLAMRKRIADYCKAFAQAIERGEIQRPSPGDCWGCLMNTKNGDPAEFPMLGPDHIIEHFNEGYFVPSLLMRAIQWRKYPDPAFIWQWFVERKESDTPIRALRQYLQHVMLREVK